LTTVVAFIVGFVSLVTLYNVLGYCLVTKPILYTCTALSGVNGE